MCDEQVDILLVISIWLDTYAPRGRDDTSEMCVTMCRQIIGELYRRIDINRLRVVERSIQNTSLTPISISALSSSSYHSSQHFWLVLHLITYSEVVVYYSLLTIKEVYFHTC